MINKELIKYLHSVYPKLPIDINYIKGYSIKELGKIERLYNVKIVGQLYEFLLSMGRCSGGFFGDDPLIFYREQKTVRSHFLSQYGLWDDLRNLQQFEYCDKKPFLVSIESETLYFFLLTDSECPDLIYAYDENEETIEATSWTLNEYLKRIIDLYTRNYKIKVTPDQYGELINI
jgi:hypothetical protein